MDTGELWGTGVGAVSGPPDRPRTRPMKEKLEGSRLSLLADIWRGLCVKRGKRSE